MVSVQLRLRPGGYPGHMNEMRMWLGLRRFAHLMSTYNLSSGAAARVEFKRRADAEAFAKRFAGDLLSK